MVGFLTTGHLDIRRGNPKTEGLHEALSRLKPSGYCLKRISIFENPISANLEFSKEKSWRNDVFKLELSVENDGKTLNYAVPNVSIFASGGRKFAEEVERALAQLEPNYG